MYNRYVKHSTGIRMVASSPRWSSGSGLEDCHGQPVIVTRIDIKHTESNYAHAKRDAVYVSSSLLSRSSTNIYLSRRSVMIRIGPAGFNSITSDGHVPPRSLEAGLLHTDQYFLRCGRKSVEVTYNDTLSRGVVDV